MLDERGHDVGSEQMASLIGDAGNKVSYASSWQSFVPGIIYHGSAVSIPARNESSFLK